MAEPVVIAAANINAPAAGSARTETEVGETKSGRTRNVARKGSGAKVVEAVGLEAKRFEASTIVQAAAEAPEADIEAPRQAAVEARIPAAEARIAAAAPRATAETPRAAADAFRAEPRREIPRFAPQTIEGVAIPQPEPAAPAHHAAPRPQARPAAAGFAQAARRVAEPRMVAAAAAALTLGVMLASARPPYRVRRTRARPPPWRRWPRPSIPAATTTPSSRRASPDRSDPR